MRIKIDAHVHSWASDGYKVISNGVIDELRSIKGLLLTAVHRGLNGLIITDHNTMEGYLMAQRVASEPAFKKLVNKSGSEGFMVIPGIELTVTLSNGGLAHLLGYFNSLPDTGEDWVINEHGRVKHCQFKPYLPVSEAINLFHEHGGLAFAAHPYHWVFGFGDELDLYADSLDGCGVNATVIGNKGNIKALGFAESHGLSITAGTDDHSLNLLGMTYSSVSVNELSISEVLNAYRNGLVSVGYSLNYTQRVIQLVKEFNIKESVKKFIRSKVNQP